MTPGALQIAPLKKHRGADTGTVHVGISLNIKNGCGAHKPSLFFIFSDGTEVGNLSRIAIASADDLILPGFFKIHKIHGNTAEVSDGEAALINFLSFYHMQGA
jgi:hypothetical protein